MHDKLLFYNLGVGDPGMPEYVQNQQESKSLIADSMGLWKTILQ